MGQRNGGFQVQWHFGNEFTCDETGISVLVNKSSHKVPQYSFKLGRYGRYEDEGSSGPLMPFILARVTRDDIFSGILDTRYVDLAVDLWKEAIVWAKEDLQHECNRAAEDQERRDAEREDWRNEPEESEVPSVRPEPVVAAPIKVKAAKKSKKQAIPTETAQTDLQTAAA